MHCVNKLCTHANPICNASAQYIPTIVIIIFGTIMSKNKVSLQNIQTHDAVVHTETLQTERAWNNACIRPVLSFFLSQQQPREINKEQKRAPAPFCLIPFLCGLHSLRSSSFAADSFSCSLAAVASPRLSSCLLFASWACKPTTHKPFKMKPNRL